MLDIKFVQFGLDLVRRSIANHNSISILNILIIINDWVIYSNHFTYISSPFVIIMITFRYHIKSLKYKLATFAQLKIYIFYLILVAISNH